MQRRDVLVALATAGMTLACVACVAAFPARPAVSSSTIVAWNSMTATPSETGSVRTVVQSPTATLDELEIHITTLEPEATSHVPHQHPAEQLIVVQEGTVESLVNSESKRVGPGSIVVQAANQLHGIRNVGDEPATSHVEQWQSPGMLKK